MRRRSPDGRVPFVNGRAGSLLYGVASLFLVTNETVSSDFGPWRILLSLRSFVRRKALERHRFDSTPTQLVANFLLIFI